MDATRTAYGVVQDKKNTFFSKVSGLPGYKPPFPIRVGYYITYPSVILGFLASIVFLGWAGVDIIGGTEVLQTVKIGKLRLSLTLPITGFGVSIGFLLITGTLLRGIDRISMIFEREYEQWIETVVPENYEQRYPPQEYWEVISDSEIEEPPAWGPRELRDDTLSEKAVNKLYFALSSILTMRLLQLVVVLQKNSPPLKNEMEKQEIRGDRKTKYKREP